MTFNIMWKCSILDLIILQYSASLADIRYQFIILVYVLKLISIPYYFFLLTDIIEEHLKVIELSSVGLKGVKIKRIVQIIYIIITHNI